MLYRGTKPGALYKGAYKPGKLYKGTQLVAGYEDVAKAAPASWDGTYDDVVGVAAQGRGKQQTYSGKNLFDPSWLTGLSGWTQDGDVYSGIQDALYKAYGKDTGFPIAFEAGKQYTISYYIQAETDAQLGRFFVEYADGSMYGLAQSTTARQQVTHVTEAGKTVRRIGYSYAAQYRVKIYLDHIQIAQESSITAYEPYVGGQPSPSPDYPQPLVASEGSLTASGRTGTTPTTVTLPVLRAIPGSDIRDTLEYVGGGHWKVTRRVGVTVVDGETVKFADSSGRFWNLPSGSSPGVGEYKVGKNNLGLKVWSNELGAFFYTEKAAAMAVGIESGAELNALCQVTPMTIWYELAAPTTETVTLGTLPSYPVHTELDVSGDYPPDVTATVKVGT